MQSEPEHQAQSHEKKSFLERLRHNIWGVVTLVIVAVACFFIVQMFKKPGQMSVLESQAMDMSVMVPPKGAVPVAIARATVEPISGSVTYTGTIQAYTDEDVYPRVTGRVVKMLVYPGDSVKKGQLLVQLDVAGRSEYANKRMEAASAEDAAMHNAGIAKSEFTQKKYELEAAKEAQIATEKGLAEAQANLNYWKPELVRQNNLLQSQVVSLDEYQKELAQLNVAQAQFEQAQAKQREAKNTKLAAQAALDTMIHHVGHQYSQAKQAEAALRYATVYEDYTRILAQEDGVVTKRLISPGVVVNPGMMLLKVAHIKQVRVQAEVASEDSDKIALGNKVYIKGSQNSSQEQIAKITSIFPAADPGSRTITVEALVDNVVKIQPQSSTPTDSHLSFQYLPGQYVVMRISTGERNALTVPTSAIIWKEGKAKIWKAGSAQAFSEYKKYQCPMHPEVVSDKPGKCPKCGMELKLVELNEAKKDSQVAKTEYTCTMHPEVITDAPGKCPKCGMPLVEKERGGKNQANLVDIVTGLTNPDKTEVISGLSAGDQVVYAGYANLQPGVSVIATDWNEAGPVTLPKASEVQGNRLDTSNNWTHEQMSGDLMLKVSLQPAKGGSNFTVVEINKHGGGAISGVNIGGKTSMPGMGDMAGPDLHGTTGGDGKAQLKSDLSSGLWRLKLNISPPGTAPVDTTLDVEVP